MTHYIRKKQKFSKVSFRIQIFLKTNINEHFKKFLLREIQWESSNHADNHANKKIFESLKVEELKRVFL